jgi:hypothetical protein
MLAVAETAEDFWLDVLFCSPVWSSVASVAAAFVACSYGVVQLFLS